MRVVFDIVHPAHVHFYRHLHAQLEAEGHKTLVVGRKKDVTLDLLETFGIPHVTFGSAGQKSLVGHGWELAQRTLNLARLARRFRADVILTRNPSGVQAARLVGAIGVFDTDDGTAAGIHFATAKPFAHVITTPDCLGENFGPRHRTYAGYKALAYLHPNRFKGDPRIRELIGVKPDESVFVVRFSAYQASHDRAAKGLSDQTKVEMVRRLAAVGRVVITSERELPTPLAHLGLTVPPTRLHDVLSIAALTASDSQTMTAESAILGVPAYRLSTFSASLNCLTELQDRYKLVHNYRPGEEERFLADLDFALSSLPQQIEAAARARQRMLQEKVDVTAWYRDLLDELQP